MAQLDLTLADLGVRGIGEDFLFGDDLRAYVQEPLLFGQVLPSHDGGDARRDAICPDGSVLT